MATKINSYSFNSEDLSQIIVGSFAFAVPIVFAEEAWRISNTLPMLNLMVVLALSICFLIFFTFQSVFQHNIKGKYRIFVFRIIIAYLVSASIVAILLFALNKLPITTDLTLSLKRIILITMPASMGGIVVDSIDKE